MKTIGAIDGWGTASVGDNVEKMGATSGHTSGVISSTTFTATLSGKKTITLKDLRPGKVDSQFIVQQFGLLHAGGSSFFIIHY